VTHTPVIRAEGIYKSYKIFHSPQDRLKQFLFRGKRSFFSEFGALKDVHLQVFQGETVGIIGRNGSGKSTLLQIIAGTLTPSAGTIEVKGKVAALLELGSGFNPEFTGRENVYMNGAILGLTRAQVDELLPQILEFADIGDFIDQPIKTYSSGMAVRLAFAVQAMVPKEVLIVDEALAVGDELFQRKCYAKIEQFKQQGGTILFVSHSAASIIELCDRAVLMDDGEMLMVGPSKRVVNLYQKLIYAPADKRKAVREEILLGSVGNETGPTAGKSKQDAALVSEMFDPHLIPKETFHYESRGALIFDAEITTLSGQRVNLLKANEKYIWRYFVNFTKSCSNIRLGMLIKTVSGLELGGATSAQASEGIPFVDVGQILKVEFTFIPRLHTGTYFLNGGVLGITEEGEVFLNRGIDLAVFKILPREDSLMTCIVDFGVDASLSFIDK